MKYQPTNRGGYRTANTSDETRKPIGCYVYGFLVMALAIVAALMIR